MGLCLRSASRRENLLGAFAPFAVLLFPVAWTVSLILGYGLILHALGTQIRPEPESLGAACYLAGVSFFSVGYGDMVPTSAAARTVTLLAAASGLAVMALVISLLFNLHSAFQRREVFVLSLDARAGAPPSGVTLLSRTTWERGGP